MKNDRLLTAFSLEMKTPAIIISGLVFVALIILLIFYIFKKRDVDQRLKKTEDSDKLLIDHLTGGILKVLISGKPRVLQYSEGLLKMLGVSEASFLEYQKTGLIDSLIYEEDRDRINEFLNNLSNTRKSLQDTFRVCISGQPLRRISIFAVYLDSTDEGPVFNFVIATMPEEALMYRKILDKSDSAVYICEEGSFKILYMSEKTRELFPVENGDYFGKKCYEYFMNRYAPCPFCHLEKLNSESLTDRTCTDEINHRAFIFHGRKIDWNGMPAIINFIEDNTRQVQERRKTQEHYHRQITLMSDVNPQALLTCRMNITKNSIGEFLGQPSAELLDGEIDTVDELFEFAYEHCASLEDEKAFSNMFNRVNLIQSFNEGVTRLNLDHGYYMDSEDTPTWMTTSISMAQNPLTGDVEAVLYANDISRQKIAESMLRTVADGDYDFIAVLDLKKDTIQKFFGMNVPKIATDNSAKNYSALMKQNVRENSADIDMDHVIGQLSLQTVKKELYAHRRYNVYYMEYDPSGIRRYKRHSFTYVDRTRGLVCLTVTDMTDEHEHEIKVRETYDAAIEASRHLINAPMQVLPSVNPYHFAGKKVLLAEDHPLNFEIARNLLSRVGFTVVGAKNGQEAIDLFQDQSVRYDVIMMDIRMPVMDGLTATRKIRKLLAPEARTIPIIAMTADVLEEDIHQSKEAGMNGHLAKPLDPKKLYEMLIKLL